MKNIAIVIMAISILMSVFTGFNIITQKKVVDIGSLEISTREKTPIYWSPVTGLILVVVGGVMFFVGRGKVIK